MANGDSSVASKASVMQHLTSARVVAVVLGMSDMATSAFWSNHTADILLLEEHTMIANASLLRKDRVLDQTASLQNASALNDLSFSMITTSRKHQAFAHRELRDVESSYNCGWETADECGWYSIDTDQAVWTRGQGKTGSKAYGPSSAAIGTFFIYSECALKNGKTFTYQVNFGSRLSIASVSFQYFLYGRGFQDVRFQYSIDSLSWISVWQKTTQTQSSQADPWLSATLDVSGIYPQYFRFSNAQPSTNGGTGELKTIVMLHLIRSHCSIVRHQRQHLLQLLGRR
jgi:hypothetical protein